MNDEKYRILRIQFSKNKITFLKSDTSSKPADLNTDIIRLELNVSRIFHKALNKTRVEGIFEKNDFEFFGGILFKLLCLNNQQDARLFVYNEFNYVNRAPDLRGLIILEFQDDVNELAVLPWEYMQVVVNKNESIEIEPFYVSAKRDRKFDLVRFVEDKSNDNSKDYSPVDSSSLTIINVVSCPDNMLVDKEKQLSSLNRLIREFTNKSNNPILEVYPIEDPDEATFTTRLKEIVDLIDTPYIFHFFGHARMNGEEPEIAFVKSNSGSAQWIGVEKFENFFHQTPGLKLPLVAAFQACESGQINSHGEGIGINLIRKHIPFVIAMQNEVTEDTSVAFFEEFYRALLSGENIFKAVTIGRSFLGCEYLKSDPNSFEEQYNSNSFGTPVIYSSTVEPIRFFPKKEKKEIHISKKMKCSTCGKIYPNDSYKKCLKMACPGPLIPMDQDITSVKSDRGSSPDQNITSVQPGTVSSPGQNIRGTNP
jgi:hypothetical protein